VKILKKFKYDKMKKPPDGFKKKKIDDDSDKLIHN
jgi:hypothetical protein